MSLEKTLSEMYLWTNQRQKQFVRYRRKQSTAQWDFRKRLHARVYVSANGRKFEQKWENSQNTYWQLYL